MSAQHDPRLSAAQSVRPAYYYRRHLTVRELLPAVGVGIGAGVIAFYIAKLAFERTPLDPRPTSGRRRLAPARVADPPPHPAIPRGR
jgi:hypothetical protein